MDVRRESGHGRQERSFVNRVSEVSLSHGRSAGIRARAQQRPFMSRVSEVSHGRPAGIRVRVSGEVFHERNICGKIEDIMENEVR